MSNHLKHLRSLRSALGLSAAAVVAGSMAFAGVAGATTQVTSGAANNIIVGSGSSTTYNMMQTLDTLYNTALGCTIVVDFASGTAQQPLNFSCLDSTTLTNGHNLSPVAAAAGVTPNPFNDVAVEEPAIGSSTGIVQLEGNVNGINDKSTANYPAVAQVTHIDFARSSRAFSSGSDQKGLNFVAYAADGVTWTHYTKVNNVAANSVVPSNILTLAQLQGIYNGTITNWSQVGGSTAPIIVFSGQEGSGTQSQWKTFLGPDPSALTNKVNCFNLSTNATWPAAQTNTNCSGPVDIFENETAQLSVASLPTSLTDPTYVSGFNHVAANPVTLNQSKTLAAPTSIAAPAICGSWIWGCTHGNITNVTGPAVNTKTYTEVYTLATPTAAQVQSDSVFFYSSGLFNHQCVASGQKDNTAATCAAGTYDNGSGATAGKSKYLYTMGRIGGSATVSGNAYGANTGCALSTVPGVTDSCLPTQAAVLAGVFPDTRKLFNVYSNGTGVAGSATTAATLNYISETGFLCSPTTVTEIDPITNLSYRTEINNAILASGFYPLSAGQSQGSVTTTPYAETGLTTYASAMYPISANPASPYAPFLAPSNANTDQGSGAPLGFCTVTTSDTSGKSS